MPAGVARLGDEVKAVDTHLIQRGQSVTPEPVPFDGTITQQVCTTVTVNGKPVAVVDSVAVTVHIPPGGSFVHPPSNRGIVLPAPVPRLVTAGGQALAAMGDPVRTCNDPVDLPVGTIVSGSADVSLG